MNQLLYIADPMCSWCWGFAPVIEKIEAQLREEIELQLVLGGLAPDSDVPMDNETLHYVQNAWRAVAARTGAEFNHSFWEQHHPKRSPSPCRVTLETFAIGQVAHLAGHCIRKTADHRSWIAAEQRLK